MLSLTLHRRDEDIITMSIRISKHQQISHIKILWKQDYIHLSSVSAWVVYKLPVYRYMRKTCMTFNMTCKSKDV